MINELKQIESLVGIEYENWTEEILINLIGDKEIFNKLTADLITYLVDNRVNNNIIEILRPIKYINHLKKAEQLALSYVKDVVELKITKEEFESNINLMISKENILEKAIGYLTLLTMLDTDIQEQKEEIQKTLSGLIDIVNLLSVDKSLSNNIEFIDLVYLITEMYFQKYQDDISIRKDELDKIVDALDMRDEEIEEYLRQVNQNKEETE